MARTSNRDSVIIVASQMVYEFFEDYRSVWDIQPFTPDIDALWNGLAEQPDGTRILDNTSRIIIIEDNFFDETGESQEFETAVATMMPHACVMILNYRPEAQGLMSDRIHEYATQELYYGDENHPYYFIDKNNPQESIAEAWEHWLQHQDADETTNQTNETQQLGKVITVTSSKGGSGKSGVALLLASQIAQSSQKSYEQGDVVRPLSVVVVDLDVSDSQIGNFIAQVSPTALNIRVSDRWDQEVIEANLVHPKNGGGFRALLGPRRAASADDLPPEFYQAIIAEMRTFIDIIILDTSPYPRDELRNELAYPIADDIILVTQMSQAVLGSKKWLQEVATPVEHGGQGIDPGKVSVVINKYMSNVGVSERDVAKALQATPILERIPSMPEDFERQANLFRIHTLLKRETPGTQFHNIAQKLVGDYPLAPLVEIPDTPQPAQHSNPEVHLTQPQPKKKSALFGRR